LKIAFLFCYFIFISIETLSPLEEELFEAELDDLEDLDDLESLESDLSLDDFLAFFVFLFLCGIVIL
jgi:hypothetical protein